MYLSPVVANAAGGVEALDRRVCVFERTPSEPLWRHFDIDTEALESRPAIELVVRFISTVGNYDYVLDWVLDQRGQITFRGGATGIDQGRSGADARRPDGGRGHGLRQPGQPWPGRHQPRPFLLATSCSGTALGFHHVPSVEDWPVYNLGWHSVTLKPFNFFDRNPAVDVPPLTAASTAADGRP
jgi:Cu2+-containing amine oxidase